MTSNESLTYFNALEGNQIFEFRHFILYKFLLCHILFYHGSTAGHELKYIWCSMSG